MANGKKEPLKSSSSEISFEQTKSTPRLWVGRSAENKQAAEMLMKAGVVFVPVPASGLSKPELVVGSETYRGTEQIQAFLRKK